MKALGDLAKVITFVVIFQNRKRDLFGDALRRVLREPMSGKKVAGGNPAETQQQDPVAKPKVFATRRLGACDQVKSHPSDFRQSGGAVLACQNSNGRIF